MDISIHNVTKITIGPINELGKDGETICRDLEITSVNYAGEEHTDTIRLFSKENPEQLQLVI